MHNILLIGSGAREHAVARALKKNSLTRLYAVMKNNNPGIRALSEKVFLGDELDVEKNVLLAKEINADFAVIGPEAPLEKGVADALEKNGVPCIGPKKQAAKLETSKLFARQLMKDYNVSCSASFHVFDNLNEAREFVESANELFVVKPLGLTGGKGVKIFGETLKTKDDAIQYARDLIEKEGTVIIEEKMDGEEFTLQALVSKNKLAGMPLVQDHKRAFENDFGPNTGGMGAYSDFNHLLPFVSQEDKEKALNAMQETLNALGKEGTDYNGILYGGFINTAQGPKVIEFNARFGDPEAMNVLSLLETDFTDACFEAVEGKLPRLGFVRKATVVKYVVPAGYPDKPQAGQEIFVNKKAFDDVTQLYYAAVNEENGKIYSTKSRTLAVNGIGESIEEAEKRAQKGVEAIKGAIRYRRDIGTKTLLEKRIRRMKELRSR